MNISLSPRLLTCCNFICPGDRVADVGTDHGYLGIWLLQQGIASSVIASDIVPGPLSAAERNVEKYGFTAEAVCRKILDSGKQVQLCCSDKEFLEVRPQLGRSPYKLSHGKKANRDLVLEVLKVR